MDVILLNTEFLGTKLINPADLYVLMFRFALNLLFIAILVRGVYYRFAPKKDFAFTFFIFNVIIFFACYFMSKMEISMGFAFGLFAIFGILRYRTTTVPIKEMTYLLAAIVLALVNAIITSKITYIEILIANVATLICAFGIESIWYKDRQYSKLIAYENIEMITPDHKEAMLEDLRQRTGLHITQFEIEEIDFLRDSASVRIYYKK